MNIINQKVPSSGVKYISDWKEYVLPQGHCIVDKGVTGCGYTEYCLTNEYPLVLCSPRKLLLENKRDQHKNDQNIIYLKNINTKDYSGYRKMREIVRTHIKFCSNPFSQVPPKILVTYDSLHHLIEIFNELNINLGEFRYVVDEFQSVFMDSFFKASTEFNFVEYLQKCPDVLYLSATPMLEKYLEKVPEFKDLPYYKLDWSDTGYVETVKITRQRIPKSISGSCIKIINQYLSGNYPVTLNTLGHPVFSNEAVFFLNSVSDIVRIIKRSNLHPSQVNIICADDIKNIEKLKKLSREMNLDSGDKFSIGKVPLKDEPNKMFTFCTKTAYIGADFYSTCAKSYVFADPNIKCMATDISQDLPQIVGRQRNRENPFKNEITLFYKLINEKEVQDRDYFDKEQNKRRSATEKLLSLFEKADKEERVEFLKKLRDSIDKRNYSDDFVSISSKTGLPVHNKFIEIANERAWEVAQKDYQTSITVTKSLEASCFNVSEEELFQDNGLLDHFKSEFSVYSNFTDKLRIYCDFMDFVNNTPYFRIKTLEIVQDSCYQRYYDYYGTSGCKALGYVKANLEENLSEEAKLSKEGIELIYNAFRPGEDYLKSEAKRILGEIYRSLDITKTAKASDLGEYFEIKPSKITNPETGKRENGFRLIKKKY